MRKAVSHADAAKIAGWTRCVANIADARRIELGHEEVVSKSALKCDLYSSRLRVCSPNHLMISTTSVKVVIYVLDGLNSHASRYDSGTHFVDLQKTHPIRMAGRLRDSSK